MNNEIASVIFSLSKGDRFVLENTEYTVRRFFKKRLPKIGSTLICETIDENEKIAWFTRNLPVIKIEI